MTATTELIGNTTKNTLTSQMIELLTGTIDDLEYIKSKSLFKHDGKYYKFVQAKDNGKKTTLYFKEDNSIKFIEVVINNSTNIIKTDGFNKAERVKRNKAEYQKQYYLNKTKLRRQKEREENPLVPKIRTVTCKFCGKTFETTATRACYCPDCQEQAKREYKKRYANSEKGKEALNKSYQNRKNKINNDPEYREAFYNYQKGYKANKSSQDKK